MRGRRVIKILILVVFFTSLIFFISGCATELTGDTAPVATDTNAPQGIFEQLAALLGSRSATLQIVGLLTILTIAPSILILLTGFTRIVIVLSFTRNALGMQQMPPNQVIVGLALFLTFFVMGPILDTIRVQAYEPYVAGEIEINEAVDNAMVPLREFMFRQTFRNDLDMFMGFANEQPVTDIEQVPTRVLIPAFITSEIKRGFMIGFFIYIPFIVVDMIVASTLMAMGMMMLPPIVISLPFKVLLFVVVDGWMLTIQSLIGSFG